MCFWQPQIFQSVGCFHVSCGSSDECMPWIHAVVLCCHSTKSEEYFVKQSFAHACECVCVCECHCDTTERSCVLVFWPCPVWKCLLWPMVSVDVKQQFSSTAMLLCCKDEARKTMQTQNRTCQDESDCDSNQGLTYFRICRFMAQTQGQGLSLSLSHTHTLTHSLSQTRT